MKYLSKYFNKLYDCFLKLAPVSEKLHQKQGIRWMFEKEMTVDKASLTVGSKKIGIPRGGLLADEMGLGKTIQFIGLLCFNPQDTLIVVPLALLGQWEHELMRISGHRPIVYHGVKKKCISYANLCSQDKKPKPPNADLARHKTLCHLLCLLKPFMFLLLNIIRIYCRIWIVHTSNFLNFWNVMLQHVFNT